MVDAVELVKRLREACNGHPHAKIPWPHRILHEAASAIEALVAERDEALTNNTNLLIEMIEGWQAWHTEAVARAESKLDRLRALVEQSFRDGLIYGNNVVITDPDAAWRTSRARSDLEEIDKP